MAKTKRDFGWKDGLMVGVRQGFWMIAGPAILLGAYLVVAGIYALFN